MNNSGWVCPKCNAVFAPFMMECQYCNKMKIDYKNRNECEHVWSDSLLTSMPPQRECTKCRKRETMGYLYGEPVPCNQSADPDELERFSKHLQKLSKPMLSTGIIGEKDGDR